MGSDDQSQKLGNTLKFMIAGILSLVGIAVLILILQIYARYLIRRRERRRRTIFYALSTIGVAPSEIALNSIEPPKNGLDPLTIESLPMFNYKASRFNHVESIECSVCLSTIIEEAKIRLLPNCKHLFHAECIDLWFRSHTTCPNCRALAEPRIEPEESGLDTAVQPTAPPLEETAQLEKAGGSCSRLSSFRRIMSKERSTSRRPQSCGEEVGADDLERQT